jgi:endonuclease YncB( thermonuclease family)
MNNFIRSFVVALSLLTAPVAVTVISIVTTTSAVASENLSITNKIVGEGKIYKVVDGDTIWLNVSNRKVFNEFLMLADTDDKKKALNSKFSSVKMRIAAINTDESVHRDTSKNSKSGKKASDFLKSRAEGKKASFSCWQHGRYGRPVCGVYFEKRDMGLLMIESGYSDYVTKYGTHPYLHKEYTRASR